jgi:hypothetical protein
METGGLVLSRTFFEMKLDFPRVCVTHKDRYLSWNIHVIIVTTLIEMFIDQITTF